jgi:hypothetical protein
MMLTLELAAKIVDGALEYGSGGRMEPLCVVVLDTGGHVLALKRHDCASISRPEIATAKAAGRRGGQRRYVRQRRTMRDCRDRSGRSCRRYRRMSPLVFANASVFDGNGQPALPGEARVEGDRIVAVARGGETVERNGATVLDCFGKTLMPGPRLRASPLEKGAEGVMGLPLAQIRPGYLAAIMNGGQFHKPMSGR